MRVLFLIVVACLGVAACQTINLDLTKDCVEFERKVVTKDADMLILNRDYDLEGCGLNFVKISAPSEGATFVIDGQGHAIRHPPVWQPIGDEMTLMLKDVRLEYSFEKEQSNQYFVFTQSDNVSVAFVGETTMCLDGGAFDEVASFTAAMDEALTDIVYLVEFSNARISPNNKQCVKTSLPK